MKTETKWKREIKGKVQNSATKKKCNEEEHKLLRAKKTEQNEGSRSREETEGVGESGNTKLSSAERG